MKSQLKSHYYHLLPNYYQITTKLLPNYNQTPFITTDYSCLINTYYNQITVQLLQITTTLLPHYYCITTWHVSLLLIMQGNYCILNVNYFQLLLNYFPLTTKILHQQIHYYTLLRLVGIPLLQITAGLLLNYFQITTSLLPNYYQITTEHLTLLLITPGPLLLSYY